MFNKHKTSEAIDGSDFTKVNETTHDDGYIFNVIFDSGKMAFFNPNDVVELIQYDH